MNKLCQIAVTIIRNILLQTYCFESESCVEIKPDGSCEESTPGHHCVGFTGAILKILKNIIKHIAFFSVS